MKEESNASKIITIMDRITEESYPLLTEKEIYHATMREFFRKHT